MTGDITVAWRGVIRTVSAGNLMCKMPLATSGGSNTPFSLEYGNPTSTRLTLTRSNGGFRAWMAGADSITANEVTVLAASQGADISVAPSFYTDGALVGGSPASQYGGGGSGAPNGNTNVVQFGTWANFAAYQDGMNSAAVLSARQWDISEHFLWASYPWELLEEPIRYFWMPSATVDVSVSLTGAASTVSAGTLTPASSVAVSGSAGTLSAGTVAPSLGVAATGSAITSSAGTVTPGLAASLSGSAATASPGSVGYSAALAFTGAAITSAAGAVIAGLGVALSGAAITSARGSVGYSASISISGASMSAAGGTLGATGGTMPVNVSLRGELVRVVPGNVRVRGGTRWVEPTPQAVALPSTIDNTLPPPPRLTGDAQSDLRAQQQWLATVYDQVVKRLNMLGRIVDHEDRLNRLENPDTTN